MRLSGISYLNTEPFIAGLEELGVELSRSPPAALGRLAADDAIDVAPLSLVDCMRLSATFEPLGNFCIATSAEARSVLLFSGRPVSELDDAVIAVTDETATSVELLKVLLAQRYGVRPRAYVGLGEAADACLLIGDPALRRRAAADGGGHVCDLGGAWHEWTGLPFVFALWVVRRDAPPAAKRQLEGLLGEALQRGLRALDRIAVKRRDTGLGPWAIRDYLGGFVYVRGAAENRAIERFSALLGTRCPVHV